MERSISKYWIAQLAGWGSNFAISVFYYLNLSFRKIDNFFILITISVILGIFFTHIMRMVIKEYRFLEKPINVQIINFFIVTIIFAILYAISDVGIDRILDLRDKKSPTMSLMNEITRNSLNNFFLLFIWNLIYYTYHYVERTRRQ